MYWDILDSPAWKALTAMDQRCYMALLRQHRSFNNGDLSLPFSYAKFHAINSETTLAKSLRALVAVGLIALTRRGGSTRDGKKHPNLYRLTDYPVAEMSAKHVQAQIATHEWKKVPSKGLAKSLIAAAERHRKRAANEGTSETETAPQKMKAETPKTAAST
jgi:predicted transcriptional regulator